MTDFVDDMARDAMAAAMAGGDDREPPEPGPVYVRFSTGEPVTPGMIVHYHDPIIPRCVVYMPLSLSEGLTFSPLGRGEGPARRMALDLVAAAGLGRLHTIGTCPYPMPV